MQCAKKCGARFPCTARFTCAHPVVELRGELGQEAADGSVAVVPLDEDLGHQRGAVPQLLEVVELKDGYVRRCE